MDSKVLETLRGFLVGFSVGTVLASMMKPTAPIKRNLPAGDIVDIASEESFPASDAPAY